MDNNAKGFTIVELLIVIVVIAILAAISIVAYNGIQDRAKNNATIQSAKSVVKLINAYITQTGNYPSSSSSLCLTKDNVCVDNPSSNTAVTSDNTALITALQTVGSVPQSAPRAEGLRYSSASSRTINGVPSRVLVLAFLKGNNQDCGGGAVEVGVSPDFVDSTTGYTSNSAGFTYCYYKTISTSQL